MPDDSGSIKTVLRKIKTEHAVAFKPKGSGEIMGWKRQVIVSDVIISKGIVVATG